MNAVPSSTCVPANHEHCTAKWPLELFEAKSACSRGPNAHGIQHGSGAVIRATDFERDFEKKSAIEIESEIEYEIRFVIEKFEKFEKQFSKSLISFEDGGNFWFRCRSHAGSFDISSS